MSLIVNNNVIKSNLQPSSSTQKNEIIDLATKLLEKCNDPHTGGFFLDANKKEWYTRKSKKGNILIYKTHGYKPIGAGAFKIVLEIEKVSNNSSKALLKVNDDSDDDVDQEVRINNMFSEKRADKNGMPFPMRLISKSLIMQKQALGSANQYIESSKQKKPSFPIKHSLETSMDYVNQLFSGFPLLVEKGVPYDIKPENILIYPDGSATFSDFGLFEEFDEKTGEYFPLRGTDRWVCANDQRDLIPLYNTLPNVQKFCVFSFVATIGAILMGDHPCQELGAPYPVPSQRAFEFLEEFENSYGKEAKDELETLFNKTIWSRVNDRYTPKEVSAQWQKVLIAIEKDDDNDGANTSSAGAITHSIPQQNEPIDTTVEEHQDDNNVSKVIGIIGASILGIVATALFASKK